MRHKAKARGIEDYPQFEAVIDWIKSNCQFSVYMQGSRMADDFPSRRGWVKVEDCDERGLVMFDQPFAFGSARDWALFKLRWS